MQFVTAKYDSGTDASLRKPMHTLRRWRRCAISFLRELYIFYHKDWSWITYTLQHGL